jgi:hypothetical protein
MVALAKDSGEMTYVAFRRALFSFFLSLLILFFLFHSLFFFFSRARKVRRAHRDGDGGWWTRGGRRGRIRRGELARRSESHDQSYETALSRRIAERDAARAARARRNSHGARAAAQRAR